MIYYTLTPLDGDYEAAKATGYTAHHTSGGFEIKAFTRSPRFVGAVAQEYRELDREQKRGVVFAAGGLVVALIVLLLAHAPAALVIIVPLVGAFGAYRLCQNDSLALEAWSHATTVRANVLYDGLTLEEAELQSAKSLQDADYGWKGETLDQLVAMMRASYADADVWLAANAALCRQWVALKQPAWS